MFLVSICLFTYASAPLKRKSSIIRFVEIEREREMTHNDIHFYMILTTNQKSIIFKYKTPICEQNRSSVHLHRYTLLNLVCHQDLNSKRNYICSSSKNYDFKCSSNDKEGCWKSIFKHITFIRILFYIAEKAFF